MESKSELNYTIDKANNRINVYNTYGKKIVYEFDGDGYIIRVTEEPSPRETEVREILGDTIQSDDLLFDNGRYISWKVGDKEVVLDDKFTATELEAIAWWMRNKQNVWKKHKQDVKGRS